MFFWEKSHSTAQETTWVIRTSCLKLWHLTSCRLLESRAGPWGSLAASVLRASYEELLQTCEELLQKPFLCVQSNKGKLEISYRIYIWTWLWYQISQNLQFCINPFQIKTNWKLQRIKPVIVYTGYGLAVGTSLNLNTDCCIISGGF